MKSSYKLVPRINTPSINPGDTIDFDVFISGYGKIPKNRFNIFYSSKNLVAT